MFAVAKLNTSSTPPAAHQVFSEEITGLRSLALRGTFIGREGHMSQPRKYMTETLILFKKPSFFPEKDADLALTLCFVAVNICC